MAYKGKRQLDELTEFVTRFLDASVEVHGHQLAHSLLVCGLRRNRIYNLVHSLFHLDPVLQLNVSENHGSATNDVQFINF